MGESETLFSGQLCFRKEKLIDRLVHCAHFEK